MTIDSYNEFLEELRQKVEMAEQVGISEHQIEQKAAQIGDWLSERYNPQSPEQRVLQDLWRAADQREQQGIAGAMVKMVQQQPGRTAERSGQQNQAQNQAQNRQEEQLQNMQLSQRSPDLFGRR